MGGRVKCAAGVSPCSIHEGTKSQLQLGFCYHNPMSLWARRSPIPFEANTAVMSTTSSALTSQRLVGAGWEEEAAAHWGLGGEEKPQVEASSKWFVVDGLSLMVLRQRGGGSP
jgi:hypothetical protein